MAEGTIQIPYSRIDPFNGHNYHVWCMKIAAILRSHKLFEEIIESPEPPESQNRETAEYKVREQWNKKNADAFGIIVVNLADEIAGIFIGETKAKNVWEKLKSIYAGNIEDRRIDVGLDLKNIKMGDNESVDSYLNRARNIASESAILGQAISERELVYHVVRGVHSKLEHVAIVLRTQRSANLEDIQRALKEEENRQKRHEGNTFKYQGVGEKAFKAKHGPNDYKKKIAGNKSCYICGKVGHLAKECWHRKNHDKGHEMKKSFNTYSKKGSNHLTKRKEDCAFHTTHETCEMEPTKWSLDSGSSSHMSNNLDSMIDVTPYKTKIKLAESGREMESEVKGNILSSTRLSDGTIQNICVKDVLYVPNLRCNLLSVHSLTEKGNTVVFNQSSVEITNNGQVVAEAKIEDNMYLLETFPRNDDCADDNSYATSSTKFAFGTDTSNATPEHNQSSHKVNEKKMRQNDKTLWHLRMGHLNGDYLETMKRNEMVRGLDFDSEKLSTCESCVLGKLAQDPFKTIEGEEATMPLNLIHIDLCGPMPVQSLGGARYIFVIVDSFTRYTTVYLLNAKHEAFDYFVKFVNRAENELDTKIKNVRSDNAKEFVSDRFENYFAEKGIHHQHTVVYTPQSNGVAERTNRTLLDKARTLLIGANLPLPFWGEAVMTATYLKNRSLTKKDKNRTPIEKWSGNKPSVSYLKVFGCTAYYYIPKQHRNKLEERAQKGIFVGYSFKRRAYRIYNPINGRVVETRSVKFDEGLKGADMLDEMTSDASNDLIQLEYWKAETEHQEIDAKAQQQNLDMQELCTLEENHSNVEVGMLVMHGKGLPKTYEEAVSSVEAERWKAAMHDELKSIEEHGVWEIAPRADAGKIIKSKWVYSRKIEHNSKEPRYKARLVALGHQQRYGIDYDDAYAPIVKLESFRILMSLAAQFNWKLSQYDVKTAYLYGELEENVYMEPPMGFEVNKGYVLKLKKSLYGLPQSGRCWNLKLNESLKNIGLVPLPNDPCVYKKEKNGSVFYMCVYVDDIFAFGTDEKIIEEVMSEVKSIFHLREMNEPFTFLGIDIIQGDDSIFLSQQRYANELLQKFKMEACNPVSTPGNVSVNTEEYESSPPVDKTFYQEIIGSLMYLNIGTRPDLAHSISKLAQYSNDPREIHMMCLKRVLRYIKGTTSFGLKYTKCEMPKVTMCTDASWCSAQNAKSFSGYLLKIGGNLISWKCQKQRIVALSTCESELVAICEGVKECSWIIGLLEDMPISKNMYHPIVVYTDSKSAIEWTHRNRSNARTKHINRRYHFIKDEVENGNVVLEHTKSAEMEADFLTKHVTTEVLKTNLEKLGIFRNEAIDTRSERRGGIEGSTIGKALL